MVSAKITDRIIVFKQGAIIETGIHDELMILEKEYYRLYTM
ncbi:ABC transporter ATP-binding protein [Bacillus sp. GZT]|nr:ABC transporter ATP-binding protein [Bacillus sp. GZT]